MSPELLSLAALTFGAAIVNGALGYGFSSLTVPIALLFLTNRVLNPALVLIEVALNGYVVFVNRAALPSVWRRVVPIMIGLIPGVIAGTFIISRVNPDWLKFATYIVLLPVILLQTAGLRRPIKAERPAGFVFGGGLGVLYAVTTISGPPLAMLLNNQGLAKQEFRAAIGLVRLAESSLAAVAYLAASWYFAVNLYTAESMRLIPSIVPSILIGVPIGAWLIRHVNQDRFRRVCMSFDAAVVAFGISTLLHALGLVSGPAAYSVVVAVVVVDAVLVRRHTRRRR